MLRCAVAALLIVLLAAPAALADVGYSGPVGYFRDEIARSIAAAHQLVDVDLTKCPATPTLDPDGKCIAQAVKDAVGAEKQKDVEEVVVVRMSKTAAQSPKTWISLRVYAAADGYGKAALTIEREVTDGILDESWGIAKKAFEPAHYHAKVIVEGAPVGAILLVDGLALEEPVAFLSAGKHVLSVVDAQGHVRTKEFDVAFNVPTHVAAPTPAPAAVERPLWPLLVTGGVAVAGVAMAVAGGIVEYFLVLESGPRQINNVDEWRDHARDTIGFLPTGNSDPFCARTQERADGDCDLENGANTAWGEHYGPLRAVGVSEPAHFTMVAVSRQNELGWRATQIGAVASVVAGAVIAVGGSAAFVALIAEPDESAAPAP